MEDILGDLLGKEQLTVALGAAGGFFGARMLYDKFLASITAVAPYPEVSDLAFAWIGKKFVPGTLGSGVATGAIVSFLGHLINRLSPGSGWAQ